MIAAVKRANPFPVLANAPKNHTAPNFILSLLSWISGNILLDALVHNSYTFDPTTGKSFILSGGGGTVIFPALYSSTVFFISPTVEIVSHTAGAIIIASNKIV